MARRKTTLTNVDDRSLAERLETLVSCSREQVLPVVQDWLLARRDAIHVQFIQDNNPVTMLSTHTRVMDELLSALFDCASDGKQPAVAVVAVGGYGRTELCPYSDIDLLFLYDGTDPQEAAAIAEYILYILWDLGLQVGQAHRNIDESIMLAHDDMSIRTTLLDERFITGSQHVFNQFQQRFENEVLAVTVQEFIEAKLEERDSRHKRFGDSRYVLEPNVKEGKGGLRDLHTLWWLARYIYRIRSLSDLLATGRLNEDEYQAFDQARQFLWRVRIHLHYITGRGEDRLTFDHQHALAVAMGYTHPYTHRAIARFMRRYFVAVRTVGNTTRIFCALLEDEKLRKPRKSLAWLRNMPWKLGGFKLDGERLNVRSEDAFEQKPVLMLEIFRMAQVNALDIHPRALQLISRNLKLIDESLRSDAHANQLFMDILLAEQGPEATLRRMSEAGVLGRFIPDFGRVVGQTQFNMYHVYTVDEHTLVALGILRTMEKGQLKGELPLGTGIIRKITMRRVLYLALFCHDIAKGRGRDHSELGEEVVIKMAQRFHFSAEETQTAAWLVRNHLLFSNSAFRRDMDDPKTIKDFVAQVRTPERLKLLLVLTAADIRAVSPSAWNAWKGSLLRDLYARAEAYMGSGEIAVQQSQPATLHKELHKQLPGWSEADVEQYIDNATPAFLAGFDLKRHSIIAQMVREAQHSGEPLLMDTYHDYPRSITDIILCASDESGLFSKVAGAMALSGANIINAKAFTLKNGLAIDVFQVQDAAGNVFDRKDKLAKMSVYLEQTLSGELEPSEQFARRRRRAVSAKENAVSYLGQVRIDNDASNICTVIELMARDRSGFLYEVTQILSTLGLTIATAHISTYGTQVADVFYVKDSFGMKITHDARLKRIKEALQDVLRVS
jgi:[protein-PII] uridylyltransferase